jgi:hypothetical protein
MGRPFIWLEGERGGWATAVVCHDGGGCGRFRRGSARAVVGSDEGASGGGTHTHTRGDDGGIGCSAQGRRRPGGARVSVVREGRLAGPAKGRGPVAGGGGGPMGGERGVGRPGWKERRAAAGPNPEPDQNSKRNSFQISIDFRIW